MGLQLAPGFTVGFLVYQFGTLFTEGSFGAGFLPGLVAVGVFAGILTWLCLRKVPEETVTYTGKW